MSIYKEAAKIGLRFQTTQGVLTTEQLFTLSLSKLATAVKAVKKQLQNDSNDDELSFLDETKVVDKEKQLQFEILKDVYLTKKEELDNQKTEAQRKENNQYILGLIKNKQDQELANKSIDELKAMLIN
jgi:hypothetical protein